MTSIGKKSLLMFLATAVAYLATLSAPSHSQDVGVVLQLQPADPPAVPDVRWRRVGPALTALHERYASHKASSSALSFAPQAKYISVADDMVVIDAAADGNVAELKAKLAQLGAVDVVAFKRVVSARLPLAAIPGLADIRQLRFARPARVVTSAGSVASQGDTQHLRFARPARVMSGAGSVTSQGDIAIRADEARADAGVDGSGVRIGVVSGSFDCSICGPGSYATDISAGDLPPGIEVLEDGAFGANEGRAMAQIAFDVAPGANFSFHTGTGGLANFGLGLQELAGCPDGSEPGCTPATNPADVIVNDVWYLEEPMFQDGIVAQATDHVVGAGVPIFAAAGNSAHWSWQGPFDSSGISPPGYPGGDAHDFDPSKNADIYQGVAIQPGITTFVFQWDQPFFSVSGAPGSTNDLEVCLFTQPPGLAPFGCTATANVGGDPIEIISVNNPGAIPVVINLTFVKNTAAGGPDPGMMKYIGLDNVDILDSYPTINSSTIFGSRNARGATTVGAAFFGNTPEFGVNPALIQPTSARGGTDILIDLLGNPIPAEVRLKPDITAPDGVNNTVVGNDIPEDTDLEPNFFGTSAAAPHAAAVGALMRDLTEELGPKALKQLMTQASLDMATPGFDPDSGSGFLDAFRAIRSLDSDSTPLINDLEFDLDGGDFFSSPPSGGPRRVQAGDSITFRDGDFTGIDGLADSLIFADGFESGDTSAWTSTAGD